MQLSAIADLLGPWLMQGQRIPSDVVLSDATDDSRKVGGGMLFCAVHGAVTDGNRFVSQAKARGAAAILSDSTDEVTASLPVLRVRPGCGYQAVARVAAAFAGFPDRSLRLYGITGTCGKSTTAYLLRDVFRGAGLRTGMIGTVVYDTGIREIPADRTTPTPFLLQKLLAEMVANGVTHVVSEVSSAALHQERFGDAAFDGASFTNFSRDHLDYHGTMEEYFQAKKRLFNRFLKDGAPAVVNVDDEWGRRLAEELQGAGRVRVVPLSIAGAAADLYPTALAGAFNRYNAAVAGTMAREAGLPDEAIRKALSASAGAPGRMQRVDCPNGVTAFVDYAHTPDEIAKVLGALRPACRGRLAILFGCGGDRDRGKRPQMAAAAAAAADSLWITSDNPRTEDPMAIIADVLAGIPEEKRGAVVAEADRRLAVRKALAALKTGDFLVLAGKGHEDYQEINHVKHPMTDIGLLEEAMTGLQGG